LTDKRFEALLLSTVTKSW